MFRLLWPLLALLFLANSAQAATICAPKDFGAIGNGIVNDTKAIQAAIDQCAPQAGTVLLANGRFLSGTLHLASHVTFSIAAGATLLGSKDPKDYPDLLPDSKNSQLSNCRKALLYGDDVDSVTVDGAGQIDGNGNIPAWTGSDQQNPERTRPMALFFVKSTNVTISDISIVHAAMWTLVVMETDHVTIQGVHINSPEGPTRDGIDLVDTHHALIDHVTIFSEDDAICLKSGSDYGLEDVVVRDSHVQRSLVAQGLKLGTASNGHFRNVLFQNIVIDQVDKAAMAVESVDGGTVEQITFDQVSFAKAGSAFFVILGLRAHSTATPGSIDQVTFENIVGSQTEHAWGSPLSGTVVNGKRYAPSNLSFTNVQIKSAGGLTSTPPMPPEYAGQYPDPNLWGNLPASGLLLRHLDHVTFTNTDFTALTRDSRQTFVVADVSELAGLAGH